MYKFSFIVLIFTVFTPVILADEKSYDETMKTISLNISEQKFNESIILLNGLQRDYPDNLEVIEKRAALYYWTHAYQASIEDYKTLYAVTKKPFYLTEIQKVMDAEAAQHSLQRKNFISFQHEFYTFDNDQATERDTALKGGVKTGDMTWIGSAASISRYNISNQQFGIEAYSNLGEKEKKRWGYLAFYQSPNASFLPQWDISGGLYQGIFEQSELSFVYRHMHFKNVDIDLLKPGITLPFFWSTCRFKEEVTLVPDTHSYSSSTTFSYDPSYRIHAFYTFTTGNSAETFRDENDIRRVKTVSHTVGGTWRFDPSWALGSEIVNTYRSQLYRQIGGKLFLTYYW